MSFEIAATLVEAVTRIVGAIIAAVGSGHMTDAEKRELLARLNKTMEQVEAVEL